MPAAPAAAALPCQPQRGGAQRGTAGASGPPSERPAPHAAHVHAFRKCPRRLRALSTTSRIVLASVIMTVNPERSRAALRASASSRVAKLSIRGRRHPASTALSSYFPDVPSLTIPHPKSRHGSSAPAPPRYPHLRFRAQGPAQRGKSCRPACRRRSPRSPLVRREP